MRHVGIRLALAVILISLGFYIISWWFRMASGLSAMPDHPTRSGEIVGAWGEALSALGFFAGWFLLAVALSRRHNRS
jgi:hypothetical protein